jgi:heme/copper-type cytochrome/quinol oxidase subunit 1
MAVVHTHTLVLGMLFFLLLVALDRLFGFTASRKLFAAFYVIYNIGLLLTLAMMMVIGTRTVLGKTAENPALNGMAGLGHILLTVALILFFVCLGVSLMKRDGKTAAVTQSQPSESNASSEANVSSEANG